MISDFMEMVRISSESGHEQEFLQYLQGKLCRDFGATCSIDTFGNLIARLSGKNSTRTKPVLFGVHADTVKPGTSIEPVLSEGVISSAGDTILGADDKAGIAELLEAIRSAERHPPLEVVVTREEEIGLNGARNLDIASLQSDLGFLMDMDDLDTVVIGGPSHMLIDIEILGKSAHAGLEPEKGISAIRAASYAITFLKEGWADRETTVNVGTIEGGEIRNGVPEKVKIKAECRSLNHQKCLAQGELIQQTFEATARMIGAKIKIDRIVAYKAISVPPDSRVVEVAKAALKNAGIEPKLMTICGGTDGSIYNENGIQTVALGIGVKNAHTVEESVTVSEMIRAVGIIGNIFTLLSEELP
jgi:tripeptide aminopeptidase